MTKMDEVRVVETTPVAAPRPGEWVITVFMVAFFAAAYLIAEDFPFRAALFPKMVAVLGLLLGGLRLVGLVRAARAARRTPAAPRAVPAAGAGVGESAATPDPSAAEGFSTPVDGGAGTEGSAMSTSELVIADDDVEDDASMEYVFASAGGKAWFEALTWIVGFFIAFFTLGAFASVPLFALFYLRFPGRASWLSAGIYALVTGVIIYLMFRELVYIPLPTGVVPFLQV